VTFMPEAKRNLGYTHQLLTGIPLHQVKFMYLEECVLIDS
jgi:hypothetical protein